ncbi:glycoprotein A33 (transmembrane), paralog a [Hoplias malabaricus]|uniref:glycoprotein A33 (transmembrane), paralog a n=1 Tax=Hoplias malabaricus TaxID=27720 RepID=UPI0034622A28
METKIFLVFLSSLVIYQSSAVTVDIPQTTYEFAKGANVTIPCKFTPVTPISSISMVNVEWMAHPDVPTDPDIEIINAFMSTSAAPAISVGDGFEGRASLLYDLTKGQANLMLSPITPSESRLFVCKVNIPAEKGKSDTTTVVVLVAPSIPICKIQGKAEYYQNINLTCASQDGTPAPTYKWANFDARNTPRPNPPKSTDVNGVLSLYNITADTSGYFICTSTNKVGSQSCNLTLTVMPPSMNIASTAGIIGAVVAALILLIVIICCCRHHNNKKKMAEEYAMGSPEAGEYSDKEPHVVEEHESKPVKSADQRNQYEDHSEPDQENRRDHYSDRRDDYDDRNLRSDDRRSDRYDDRRSDRYDDGRSDRYDDRRSDRYDDRRNDRYDDRRDQYDERERYDDRRNDRDRYDRRDR